MRVTFPGMDGGRHRGCTLLLLFVIASLIGCRQGASRPSPQSNTPETARVSAQPSATAPLERIVVAPDGRGFVTAVSQTPFHPWGMDLGFERGLMEEYWDADWEALASDFHDLAQLGANVVRVHLQFGAFMSAPDQPNHAALAQFSRLLRLAEETGIYLDVTGLGSYRPTAVPAWYNALDETTRWEAQAQFWASIAAIGVSSPAIFCYDLINEPFVPGEKRAAGEWGSGQLFGGYDFLHALTLDPDGRPRDAIAVAWIRRMTGAIRAHDPNHLVTVGLLPWTREWGHFSGMLPKSIAPELDFISVHLYPDSQKPGEALAALREFDVGKPIVIEETFPLNCTARELEEFLRASRPLATGWLGHYGGETLAALEAQERAGTLTIKQAISRDWLRLFVRLKPEFAP